MFVSSFFDFHDFSNERLRINLKGLQLTNMLYSSNSPSQTILKAVILGETQVGKTSLCNRFFQKTYDPMTATTISASCQRLDITIDDQDVTFCMWDTAGQERFRSISPIYYRGSHAAIVAIDLTAHDSLDIARSWVKELRTQGPIGVPIVILANKLDLTEIRRISKEETLEFANSVGADYFEVSALTGINVEEAFLHVARLGLQFFKEQQQFTGPVNPNSQVDVAQNEESQKEHHGCAC